MNIQVHRAEHQEIESMRGLHRLVMVLVAAVISILLSYAGSASAIAGQDMDSAKIEISPANPTAGDNISAKISGTWRNSCAPRNPQITKLDGNKIRINTSSPVGICMQALTRWSHVLDLSKLDAATYQVIVVNGSSGRQVELGRRSFTVRK